MSEHEAIELRIESLENALDKIGLIIMHTALFQVLTLSIILGSTVLAGLAVVGFAVTVLNAMKVRGNEVDGISRRITERLIGEYPDPPLKEWLESLEDRNAFPVDGDEE